MTLTQIIDEEIESCLFWPLHGGGRFVDTRREASNALHLDDDDLDFDGMATKGMAS